MTVTMTTSATGRAAIKAREGCRLTAYQDSVGVWTIGVGHSARAPSGITPYRGMTITEAEADAILADDLKVFERAVNRAITIPITQNQFDALVSLAFNIGVNGFVGSTVVHKLNSGNVMGAADAFLMWERPIELKARRIAERKQFLAPGPLVHPPPPSPLPDQPVVHQPASVKRSWWRRRA